MSLFTILSPLSIAVSIVSVVKLAGLAALLVGTLLFFKPLLVGLCRAAWLTIHPRLTAEQRSARRNMRDAKLLQRMIKETDSPGLAAELRAMGARS